MSPEKKVLLLFLALICLMIACVYTHIDEMMLNITDINKQEKVAESTQVTKIEEEKSSGEIEEKVLPESIDEDMSSPEFKSEESINVLEDSVKDELESTETLKKEKVINTTVEEPLQPLLTTDKRYTRIGNEKNIEELSTESQLLQVKINDYIRENPIDFRRASNKITKSSVKTILYMVEILKEFPNIKIELAGHTDAAGPEKLNQTISYQRAKKVSDRLIYFGIDKNRIKVRGYGENIPMVENSPQGYSRINRRVEFNIVEE